MECDLYEGILTLILKNYDFKVQNWDTSIGLGSAALTPLVSIWLLESTIVTGELNQHFTIKAY